MAIILPRRFKGQPKGAVSVNHAGLGREVKLLLNPGVGFRDVASGGIWTPNGNTKIRTVGGRSLYFDQAGSSTATLTSPDLSNPAGTFFLYASRIGSSDTSGTVFLSTSTGNNKYYHVLGGETRVDWGVGGGSTNTLTPGCVFNTVNTSIVFSTNGSGGAGKNVYVNGVPQGTADATAPTAFSAGANSLVMGAYWGGNVWDLDGDILVAGYATREWSQQDAVAFHANPWQIFKAAPRRLWAVLVS